MDVDQFNFKLSSQYIMVNGKYSILFTQMNSEIMPIVEIQINITHKRTDGQIID